MARKEKPVKIKRYNRSHNSGRLAVVKLSRIAIFAVLALLIIGVGFLLGKPVSKLLSGEKKDKPESQVTSQEILPDSQTAESENTDIFDDGVTQPSASKQRIYYYTDSAYLTTARGINNVIANAKRTGANCLVFDVKDKTGNILYNSQNQYARQLKSSVQIDMSSLVSLCADNGITPVARVYTFMDSQISNIERSTAVMYQGTDTRWLDSSRNLGGKAWANPASKIMQQYITDITDELMSLGIKEFIYAGFSTPTGYSLDKRDFGTSLDSVLAEMRTLINTLKAKVSANGGFCVWQIEYSAVSENGSYAQYIVHPYQLGAENYIITATLSETDARTAIRTVKSSGDDVKSVALWLSGADARQLRSLGNYFVN